MSWITELKDCFSRTEAEKEMAEAEMRITVGNRIVEKGDEFRRNYAKVSQDQATKDICDNLLRKIKLIN